MYFEVKITVSPCRFMTEGEAAAYCRRTLRQFRAQCPVAPVEMPNGDLLWDVLDLDAWLDRLKGTVEPEDEILSRLS
jgi:hypothetical protein